MKGIESKISNKDLSIMFPHTKWLKQLDTGHSKTSPRGLIVGYVTLHSSGSSANTL